jgi:ABC-type multidrug transport system fused ATPase/permease subunit
MNFPLRKPKKVKTIASSTKENYDHKKVSLNEFWDISRWIFFYLVKMNRLFTLGYLVTALLDAIWSIANAYVLSAILNMVIDQAQKGGTQLNSLYPYFIILLGLNAVFTAVGFIRTYFRRGLMTISYSEVSRSYYKRLEYLGIQTLEGPEMNNKLSRAQDSISQVSDYFEQIIAFLKSLFTLIMSIVIVFKIAPIVMLVMFVIYIPAFLIDKRFRALTWSWGYTNTEDRRKANSNSGILTNTVSLMEVSVIRAQSFLDKKFADFFNFFNARAMKIRKSWLTSTFGLDLISTTASYFGYLYLFARYLGKLLNVGQVFFYIRMIDTFQSSMFGTFDWVNNLFEYSIRFRELYMVFVIEPVHKDGDVVFPRLTKGPEIAFENTSFRYPNAERLVIENLSLHIKSGEKVAIVGHNGAGKTTLVKLLCRIYRPTSGKILVNDQDLCCLKLNSWYQNMGALFQEFNTYPQLTVRENISIGNTDDPVDEMAVRLAAQSADALEFIEEFPKKFDQILSEKFKGGIRPSTGQWQKLAIARFFYRDAPLVIFDEPTASIDAVSEYNIFNKIYDFFKEKTVIIISHRFSTVRNADRIIVLDHGEIVEEGTHDFLMGNNGYYAKAFNLQAKGYSDDGE